MVHEGARPVSETVPAPQVFSGDAEHFDIRLDRGLVCVRSFRSPDKETSNEDAAAVIPVGTEGLVIAVADGVGGTPSGREAASATLRTLGDSLTVDGLEPEGLRSAILDAVDAANRSVLELGRGAATTLVIGELIGTRLRSYHVGDSELLAVGQRGRIKMRLVPHSPTGFAVEAGLMDENEAVSHDQRHVLFNVIGSPEMRVDIGTPMELALRDTVLLATDGLLDNLYVDEIVEIIRKGSLPAAADSLVDTARERMQLENPGDTPSKPDDVTIVLYRGAAAEREAIEAAEPS